MMNSTFPAIYPVTCHTDHVGPGSTFVAIKGMKDDGIQYIKKALLLGASTIVIEEKAILDKATKALIAEKKAKVLTVSDTRKALANLSAQAHGYPANAMRIIGVTGTKGKTTSTFLLEHILRSAGYKTALISTVKNHILDMTYEAHLTTPQPDYLHTFFSLCQQQAVQYVVMEVAAQALSLHRVDTIIFDAAIFTNFSLEHSEFYASQDDYFTAKCALFKQLAPKACALFNADDEHVRAFARRAFACEAFASQQTPQPLFFSLKHPSDFTGQVQQSDLSALKMVITSKKDIYHLASSTLLGEFSAYNILAASAVAEHYGIAKEAIEQAVSSFEGVPGRLQRFTLPNNAVAFIDNAHTPSSFEAILSALRPLSSHVIAVFGAGGDRDALKRPIMGSIAASYADVVILTTDNPRSEDPQTIINAIQEGILQKDTNKVHCELDREQAIRCAYTLSKPGSIIALLGKGPVEYQHIKEHKIPFSEASILRSL